MAPKETNPLLNPDIWNPKSSNFVIKDWEKWEAMNPAPPKVFSPPQKDFYTGMLYVPLWWWNRSCYFQPIPCLVHSSCCAPKKEMGRISDKSILSKLLRPNPNSELVPEAVRNHLVWTENNIAAETLVSFNRWGWRSQTEEGRVIGGGHLANDWTNDTSCMGLVTAFIQTKRYVSVQASPDGKWIMLGTFSGSNPETKMNYHHIYVVQEGDEYETSDGKVIEYVKPGDLIRITWGDKLDPYACDNSDIAYQYFPRKVATLNEETGLVESNDLHYDDLYKRATYKNGKCLETCCYTCSCFMSPMDRFEFQTNNISDTQVYNISPEPPKHEVLDRL